MNAPDLHPDELLDRAAAGTLTPEEQARLDAHLSACPACRFERTARADFAALPLPSMPVDELVTRALAGMPSASLSQTPRRRRFSPAMLASAVLLVGAGSFAAVCLARPIAVFLGIVAPAPIAPPAPAPAPAIQRRAAPPVQVEPVLEPEPLPEPVPEPEPLPEQPAPAATPRMALPSKPALPPVEPVVTPAELFRLATTARTEGRRAEAERHYRELTTRFPGSPEANVAHAVMGRLLLDLERPAEAVGELEAALSSDAALREDAIANLALAWERLHEAARARAAWRQLLDEFPASIHAKRARERLEVLTAP